MIGLILVAAIFYYTISLQREVREADQIWINFSEQATGLKLDLKDLYKSLGYGGFIHHFKIYVLRRDEAYAVEAASKLDVAFRILQRLDGRFSGDAQALGDIETIRKTIQAYEEVLALARRQPAEMSAETLDDIVRIQDDAAFTAIDRLYERVRHNFDIRKKESREKFERIGMLINFGLFMTVIVMVGVLLLTWQIRRLNRLGRKEAIQRKKADAVLEGAPEAMLVVDPTGHIVQANLAASQLLEYTKEELTGMEVERLVPKEFRSAHPADRKRFFSELGQRDMGKIGDLFTVTKSGKLVDCDISLRNADVYGETFTIATIRDVTVQRKARKELERARQEADKASEMKSAFLASMSHEIRTPLTGLLGMADLLEMTALDEKQLNFMQTLKKSGHHLEGILNDILDLSKLQANKLNLNIELFEPMQLVETARSVYGAIARSKELDFKLCISPALDNKVLYGDILRLRQVLMNLIGNAIKYTDAGSVTVDVETVEGKGGQVLRVSVADTGLGIDQENLEKIFDPFVQVEDHLTKKNEGTGLGLAICKQLLDLMNGTLSATSEPGVGSTFVIEVPLRIEQDLRATCRTQPASLDTGSLLEGQSKKKILVVDDNEVNRSLLKEVVTRWGHETDIAVDGAEALEKLVSNDYDIVLMDIHMPELDGMEVLARSIELHRKPNRVYAFTADTMTESVEEYKKHGFDGVLPKPINWKLLMSIINDTENQPDKVLSAVG